MLVMMSDSLELSRNILVASAAATTAPRMSMVIENYNKKFRVIELVGPLLFLLLQPTVMVPNT